MLLTSQSVSQSTLAPDSTISQQLNSTYNTDSFHQAALAEIEIQLPQNLRDIIKVRNARQINKEEA